MSATRGFFLGGRGSSRAVAVTGARLSSRLTWRFALPLLIVLNCASALADDSANPHLMIGADGKPDASKCNVCHADDLTLTLPKRDTCTLCHSETLHPGAREHMGIEPARVARLVPAAKEGGTVLPLTDEGGIYCGTCHVFHDPRISNESVLDQSWVPSGRLAQAVRDALIARLAAAGGADGKTEAPMTFGDGTTRLRLPIADGSLCRHCHQYGK